MAQGGRRNPSRTYRRVHFELDEMARRARKIATVQAEFLHTMESGVRGRPRKERVVQLPKASGPGTMRFLRIGPETPEREVTETGAAEGIATAAFVVALAVYAVVWIIDFFRKAYS